MLRALISLEALNKAFLKLVVLCCFSETCEEGHGFDPTMLATTPVRTTHAKFYFTSTHEGTIGNRYSFHPWRSGAFSIMFQVLLVGFNPPLLTSIKPWQFSTPPGARQ